ncbi:MAG TPA: (2Fe-2S)-binding protein [Desulfatiglandales bacterium]|nr:(2Fe-2S)-binding protein [Desulfatiglandales bacterium]
MKTKIRLSVNEKDYEIEVEPHSTLLEVLRDHLKLKSVHRGCLEGECGVCTVMVNGEAVNSCLIFAVQADGEEITTLEGLMRDGDPHPLMKSFHENYGFQCGYCTSGFIMSAYSLLRSSENPSREEISKSIEGNLCRCTGYMNIVKSIEASIEKKRSGIWW